MGVRQANPAMQRVEVRSPFARLSPSAQSSSLLQKSVQSGPVGGVLSSVISWAGRRQIREGHSSACVLTAAIVGSVGRVLLTTHGRPMCLSAQATASNIGIAAINNGSRLTDRIERDEDGKDVIGAPSRQLRETGSRRAGHVTGRR